MNSTYLQAREKIFNRQYKEAWELYEIGAKEGDPKCCFGMATMLMDGLYAPKNTEAADIMFDKYVNSIKDLADNGDLYAAYIMTFYYRGGYGSTPRNDDLYFKYTEIIKCKLIEKRRKFGSVRARGVRETHYFYFLVFTDSTNKTHRILYNKALFEREMNVLVSRIEHSQGR